MATMSGVDFSSDISASLVVFLQAPHVAM